MSIQGLNWVLKQDGITNSGAKFVLMILANYADENGVCYPSQATIARLTSITDRTVRTHLEWLEREGYISKQHRRSANRRSTDEYRLELSRITPLPEIISASDEPEEISGRAEVEPENSAVSTGKFPQFEQEKSSYNTKEDSKEDTKGRVREPVAKPEPREPRETRIEIPRPRPLRSLGSGVPLPAASPPIAFGPYRDALEDWYCGELGVISLPPNVATAEQVTWLFENRFTLDDIKGFYKFATTDPEERSWRRGPVTLSAIVKGIAAWKKEKETGPETVSCPTFCDACRSSDGMLETQDRGWIPCKHEEKSALAA